MTNILVTGGTGFIGVHLVKRLASDGHNLKLLVRETSDISPFEGLKNVEYITGDIRDIDILNKAVDNVDLIYHLAAYTRKWAKNKALWEETNVIGTENIAKIALDKNIRLIYLSSFTALGPNTDGTGIPVDETYEHVDFFCLEYEKSKCIGLIKIKELINDGLKTIIFYPGLVYGPGDWNIFGEMLYDIIRGKFLGLAGKGDSLISVSYLPDIIEGMVSVVDKNDLDGKGFILGGENVKFRDYLNLIAEIAEVKKPRHFPMWGGYFYARLCEVKSKISKKEPYITRGVIDILKYNWAFSSKKAIDKLGYKITPLKEGLTKTIEWYKNFIENQKK